LDRDGSRAGEVFVPANVSPVQITVDRLVGIHHDELGVESVRVYALVRAGP
jgi:hypothetical protein